MVCRTTAKSVKISGWGVGGGGGGGGVGARIIGMVG